MTTRASTVQVHSRRGALSCLSQGSAQGSRSVPCSTAPGVQASRHAAAPVHRLSAGSRVPNLIPSPYARKFEMRTTGMYAVEDGGDTQDWDWQSSEGV